MRLRSADVNNTKNSWKSSSPNKGNSFRRSSQSCIDKINTLRIIIVQRMEYTSKLYLVFVVFIENFRVGKQKQKIADREEIWQPSTQSHYTVLWRLYISSCEGEKTTSPQKIILGVRQGRALSPTLLLMIVDGVPRKLYKKTEKILTVVSQNNLKNNILHICILSHTFASVGKKLRDFQS